MIAWLKKHRCAIAWSVGTAAALALYLSCCKSLWKSNPLFDKDATKSYDQTFYFHSAQMFANGYTGRLPRSRMPLYPWLIHFFMRPGADLENNLNPLIRVNVAISVLCLGAIFFMLRRPLGTWLAVLTTLVTAFRVFVFKAVLIQPEILFFTLFLGVFLLMLRHLKQPSWRLAIGTGLLAGVTHLTKGSALLMIAFFLVLAFAREWTGGAIADEATRNRWSRAFLRPLAFLAAFLSVAGLWLRNSQREYGNALYDPNTRYYFWAESPREMMALQHLGLADWKPRFDQNDANDPVVGEFLPKWVPESALREELFARAKAGESVVLEDRYDILPSFKHWFAAHTWRDALNRLWVGVFGEEEDRNPDTKKKRKKIDENRNRLLLYVPSVGTGESLIRHNREHPNGYWDFLRFMFGAAAVTLGLASFFSWRAVRDALAAHWIPLLFAVSVIFATGMSYAWWAHISNRNRYMLTLYLPLMTSFGLLIRFACHHIPIQAKVVWHQRSFMIGGYAIFLLAYTFFVLTDLNDPLNRHNLDKPNELFRQIVQ